MKIWLLFKVVDMSDYHDDEYNLADNHKELRGIYATKDAAERNKKTYENIIKKYCLDDDSYFVIEEHSVLQ